MDCKCNNEKHSYHFNVTEMVDGSKHDVMNFDLDCHHDLAKLASHAAEKDNLPSQDAQQLVLGVRLVSHVLKKYPDNMMFANFRAQLKEFKQNMKGKDCKHS